MPLTMREEAVEFFFKHVGNENGYVDDPVAYAKVLATAELTAIGRNWSLHKEGLFTGLHVELIDQDNSGPYLKVQIRYPFSVDTPAEWVSSDTVSGLQVTLRDTNGFLLNIDSLTFADAFDEDLMRVMYAKMSQMAQES